VFKWLKKSKKLDRTGPIAFYLFLSYYRRLDTSIFTNGKANVHVLTCLGRHTEGVGIAPPPVTTRKGKGVPVRAQVGPEGNRRFRIPGLSENRHMKVARLSVLSNGRLYPPEKVPGTHFCQRLSPPHGYNSADRIRFIKYMKTPSLIQLLHCHPSYCTESLHFRTYCINVFRLILRMKCNNEIGFCKTEEVCFLWGMKYIFKN
jgi:hypothetical protein